MALFSPRPLTLALACISILSGCANLAPNYARPDPAVPMAGQAAAQDAAELDWRDFFSDARLRGVVALALQNNRDLRVAALNVEKARASFQVQDAERLPSINVTAGASRTHAGSLTSNTRSVQLALSSFELDFFGRVKNLSDSAWQDILASDETRRSVQISLVAEVANAWLSLAADLERQQLSQQTVQSRQLSLELTQRRHELGAVTGLVLAQAQTSLESARVDLVAYDAQIAQDRNALELLLGAALPDKLAPVAGDASATLTALVELPAGVPSSVLQRRPDVLSAEHSLIAAHADIGAARAAFFPSISLTAAAGSSSASLSNLFKSGSGVWSFGPSLSLPIFDGGANRASLRSAEISRDIALATYDKTVQTAFGEVADSLAVRATLGQRLAAQQALLASTTRQLRLAEVQYRVGSTTQLDLLDAQRTLYTAQQSLITLRLTEQSNRITLYKVLGGGWKNDKES
jgi:outer membrane protein, multidrug efflux system